MSPPVPVRHSLAAAIALSLLLVAPAFALPPGLFPPDPEEVGPFEVGRTTFAVSDTTRGRTLPVDVWYPVDPEDATAPPSVYDLIFAGIVSDVAQDSPVVSSERRFPLIVFSHGNNGIRFQSYFLCEHLASHGFVVAAPDHVGNTAGDLLLPVPPPFETKDRPLDVSFVISEMLAKDEDPADPFFETLARFRIGVVGHSFGAFTSLTMASGFDDVPPDPRVRAIMPISPAASGLSDAQLASIERPAFVLGGTADTITPIDPQSIRTFELLSSRPRYRVDVLDAGHNSFTNICDFFDVLSGSVPPELLEFLLGNFDQGCAPELIPVGEAQRITNLYATAFLKRAVTLDPRYQRFLRPGFARRNEPDVTFFFVPGAIACGIGFELVLVLPPLLWWRQRRRRGA